MNSAERVPPYGCKVSKSSTVGLHNVDTVTDRHAIPRAPTTEELLRRIAAAQQRCRQLFECRKGQAQPEPQLVEGGTIPSWPEVVVRAANWLRLSDIPVCHVAKPSPRLAAQRGLLVGGLPPIVGFEDD